MLCEFGTKRIKLTTEFMQNEILYLVFHWFYKKNKEKEKKCNSSRLLFKEKKKNVNLRF